MRHLPSIALLVRDYDEAIPSSRRRCDSTSWKMTPPGGKRWVRVRPINLLDGAALLLAKAATPEQESAIGDQSGGRVFLFLRTDDFGADYEHMKAHGVRFTESPRHEHYGTVVVLLDLYGNKWDLIGPVTPA